MLSECLREVLLAGLFGNTTSEYVLSSQVQWVLSWTMFSACSFFAFLTIKTIAFPNIYCRQRGELLGLSLSLIAIGIRATLAAIASPGDAVGPAVYNDFHLGINQSLNPLLLVTGVCISSGILAIAIYHNTGSDMRAHLLRVLFLVPAVAGFCQLRLSVLYKYRAELRLTGLWVNPNTFGLLAGVGFVIGVGLLMHEWRTRGTAPKWRRLAKFTFGAAALAALARHLLLSYSRGAWGATLFGVFYLVYNEQRLQGVTTLALIRSSATTRLLAVLVCCFVALAALMYSFGPRYPSTFLRRTFSFASNNDFSVGNRILAWDGALRMLADKPMLGFGRDKPLSIYDNYYRSSNVIDGRAIELNDYFTIGTTFGAPILLLFLVLIIRGVTSYGSDIYNSSSIVARSALIVFMVAFWFDGGLFKLATCAPFWALLVLTRGYPKIDLRSKSEQLK